MSCSDLKGASGPVVKTFDVQAIPQKYLIGPDGKLLIKNGTLQEVKIYLENLFNNDKSVNKADSVENKT
jgi:hypothetical protein